MHCDNCGTLLKKNVTRCPICGTAVEEEIFDEEEFGEWEDEDSLEEADSENFGMPLTGSDTQADSGEEEVIFEENLDQIPLYETTVEETSPLTEDNPADTEDGEPYNGSQHSYSLPDIQHVEDDTDIFLPLEEFPVQTDFPTQPANGNAAAPHNQPYTGTGSVFGNASAQGYAAPVHQTDFTSPEPDPIPIENFSDSTSLPAAHVETEALENSVPQQDFELNGASHSPMQNGTVGKASSETNELIEEVLAYAQIHPPVQIVPREAALLSSTVPSVQPDTEAPRMQPAQHVQATVKPQTAPLAEPVQKTPPVMPKPVPPQAPQPAPRMSPKPLSNIVKDPRRNIQQPISSRVPASIENEPEIKDTSTQGKKQKITPGSVRIPTEFFAKSVLAGRNNKFFNVLLLLLLLGIGLGLVTARANMATNSNRQPTNTVTPTTTVISQQTSTPSSQATSGPNILLQDPLSQQDGNNWVSSPPSCVFKQAAYHVSTSDPNGFTACLETSKNFSNMNLAVQSTVVQSNGASGGLGFVFGYKDTKDYYVYFINQSGTATLFKVNGQTPNILFNNVQVPSFKLGQVENVIEVHVSGNSVTFWANGSQAGSYTDSTAPQGQVGFVAYSQIEVAYSNLKITQNT